MYRKTIFISSVLFGLVFFGMAGKSFADAEADFEQAAAYKKDGDYQQAEVLYQTIVTDYAGTKYALRAQRHLIYSLLGRKADLQEAIDKLVADFSAVAGFVPALYDVAGRCEERKQYEHAKRIYEKITEKFPEPSERAATAQVHISKVAALPLIDSNDIAAAEAATDKLINDFSGNPALPDAIYDIATKYETSNHFEHAKNLCRKVVADYPGTKYAFRAQRKLLRLYISVGPKSSIQGAVDQLVTDFSYYPDMARTLRDLAKKLERQGELEQAKSMYEIAHTIQGLRDQAKLTISYISAGDYDQASEAVDKLIADFNEHSASPMALYDIAGKYAKSARYEEAKRIYEGIVTSYPGADCALNAQRNLVMLYIGVADYEQARTALEELIADFAGHSALPAALCDIAGKYNGSGKFAQAKSVYQQIIQNHPDSPWASRAEFDLARTNIFSLIDAGDDTNAMAAIDTLIADFNNHPDISTAVIIAAEKYSGKARLKQSEGLDEQARDCYQKSVTIRERIIQQLPPSAITPQAYYTAAVVYSQRLGEYQKGIDYYQKVVDDWPEYEYASFTQYFIGKYYEKLRDSGGLSKLEANPKIEQAYHALIEKYPDSEQAKYIAFDLGQANFDKGNWADAAMYFELAVQKSYENEDLKGVPQIVYRLGQVYEKMGESELAAQVYKDFLNTSDPNDPHTKAIEAKLETLQGEVK